MMARRGVLGVLAGGAAALLSGCRLFGGNSYRYKLTVEVETPEGLPVGSAVRQIDWASGVNVTMEADTASMSHKRDAVIADLPTGEMLSALMAPDGQETPMLAFGSAALKSNADRSLRELYPPTRPEARHGEVGFPRLVRFRDINDPGHALAVTRKPFAKKLRMSARLDRVRYSGTVRGWSRLLFRRAGAD